MMALEERQTLVAAAFRDRYGQTPAVWARAPGRVDLMGSHTDYNLGYVMTMTIDRDTWMAAAPRADRCVSIYSLNFPGGGVFSLDDIGKDGESSWTNYVRGVAVVLQEAGYALKGFDGIIHSTVPLNSGLSSSAAIEMVTAVMFQLVGGFRLEPVQMALLGQKAENSFVGVSSGILDQYSSALGQAGSALLLDCRALTSRSAPIPAGIQVVICDTRAERNLVGSEYDDRRAQCEAGVRLLRQFYPDAQSLRDISLAQFEAHEKTLPEVIARRCRFIIEENARVLRLADALSSNNQTQLRTLLADSYAGARDLYEIGAPAMEQMMAAMLSAPGVIGARQAGAGFGGCMVALVEAAQVDAFSQHVQDDYQQRSGIRPNVYPVTAAPGAGPLL